MKRYDKYTKIRALAHFFSACTVTMAVRLIVPELTLLVIFYPFFVESIQFITKAPQEKFDLFDTTLDFVELFAGCFLGMVILAVAGARG